MQSESMREQREAVSMQSESMREQREAVSMQSESMRETFLFAVVQVQVQVLVCLATGP
jgi:hypothetical protein